MEFSAQTKSSRISTRKMRLVADAIRNLTVARALEVLELTDKRAARDLYKTLASAIANAKYKQFEEDGLYIFKLEVNEGPALKRFRPSTRGRVHPYKKRSSHITVVLKTRDDSQVKSKKENKKEGENSA